MFIKKKGQINQIFVYLVSIIIIVFVGFLVLKFITFFTQDVDDRKDSKLYIDLNNDYDKVYRSFGSASVETYFISEKSDMICFFDSKCDINNSLTSLSINIKEELLKISSTGNSIALIDNSTNIIINSNKFENSFDGCFCIELKSGKFSLHYENLRNKVYIQDADLN